MFCITPSRYPTLEHPTLEHRIIMPQFQEAQFQEVIAKARLALAVIRPEFRNPEPFVLFRPGTPWGERPTIEIIVKRGARTFMKVLAAEAGLPIREANGIVRILVPESHAEQVVEILSRVLVKENVNPLAAIQFSREITG